MTRRLRPNPHKTSFYSILPLLGQTSASPPPVTIGQRPHAAFLPSPHFAQTNLLLTRKCIIHRSGIIPALRFFSAQKERASR